MLKSREESKVLMDKFAECVRAAAKESGISNFSLFATIPSEEGIRVGGLKHVKGNLDQVLSIVNAMEESATEIRKHLMKEFFKYMEDGNDAE